MYPIGDVLGKVFNDISKKKFTTVFSQRIERLCKHGRAWLIKPDLGMTMCIQRDNYDTALEWLNRKLQNGPNDQDFTDFIRIMSYTIKRTLELANSFGSSTNIVFYLILTKEGNKLKEVVAVDLGVMNTAKKKRSNRYKMKPSFRWRKYGDEWRIETPILGTNIWH